MVNGKMNEISSNVNSLTLDAVSNSFMDRLLKILMTNLSDRLSISVLSFNLQIFCIISDEHNKT